MLPSDGSSPRMRGALTLWTMPVDFPGIIPADAGSTLCRESPCVGKRDHPRGCGEHDGQTINADMWTGSSPRMRGAQDRACGR